MRRQAASNGAKGTTNGTTNGTKPAKNGTKLNGHKSQNGVGPGHAQTEEGLLSSLFNRILSPLFLMLTTPNLVIGLWYTAVHCDGSFMTFGSKLMQNGLLNGLWEMWSKVTPFNPTVMMIIAAYFAFAIFLQMAMPGRRWEGPLTDNGNTPIYKDNGFLCFIVSMVALGVVTYVCKQNGTSPTFVFDHFGDFLASMNIFSLLFCLLLYIKGLTFPSSSDNSSTGNPIFDYYWGTELYPRIFGVDIKVLTNCRFGLTVWAALVMIFALKSYELHGFIDSMWISCVLQMVYLTKFFWWEAGYMRTIDIMVDRAGYYICWGCLVYVPGLYASVSLYFVKQPIVLGPALSIGILSFGIASIAINYIADYQRYLVRSTDAQCTIWGEKPKIIRAKYEVFNGVERQTKESILLVSGWWGVARHFHYLPELCLAFAWTVPALFTNIMPYSYWIFLFVLLVHRTFRDDEKCRNKYTTYWAEYCKQVPYKIIPGIF